MEEIDLKELFKVFWEKKLYIVLTVIVFAVFGVIYSTKIIEKMLEGTEIRLNTDFFFVNHCIRYYIKFKTCFYI